MSLALKASGELAVGGGASSPKRGALPDALLRGIKLHQPPEPPVYIPNLQEETILAVSIVIYFKYQIHCSMTNVVVMQSTYKTVKIENVKLALYFTRTTKYGNLFGP